MVLVLVTWTKQFLGQVDVRLTWFGYIYLDISKQYKNYTHMKKSKGNLTLAIIVTAVIGTALVKVAEYIFGMTNVFLFCVTVTSIVGIIVVPLMQVKKR